MFGIEGRETSAEDAGIFYADRPQKNVRRRSGRGAGARVGLPDEPRAPLARTRPASGCEEPSFGDGEEEKGARSRTRREPRGHESFARREHGMVRRPCLIEVRHEVQRLGRRGVGSRHQGREGRFAPDENAASSRAAGIVDRRSIGLTVASIATKGIDRENFNTFPSFTNNQSSVGALFYLQFGALHLFSRG